MRYGASHMGHCKFVRRVLLIVYARRDLPPTRTLESILFILTLTRGECRARQDYGAPRVGSAVIQT